MLCKHSGAGLIVFPFLAVLGNPVRLNYETRRIILPHVLFEGVFSQRVESGLLDHRVIE